MGIYRHAVRPALFALSNSDAERAHHLGLFALGVMGTAPLRQIISSFTHVQNERKVFGLTFPNPVGLAAGFDKHAQALHGLKALGFGFIEVGTVTPVPQPGNPRPRMFRLEEDEALINRMGFNNRGVEEMAARFEKQKDIGIPVGINVGKGKNTPIEEAAADYTSAIQRLYEYGDYFTLNASSPNTADLRRLQEKTRLEALLRQVQDTIRISANGRKPKPFLLKIAPDLTQEEVDDILEVSEAKVQGLIIHNTSTARPDHLHSPHKAEAGGLSGRPLTGNALGMLAYVHRALPNLPIVGVGGIYTPDDAKRMFEAGASLIQLYTGFVYEGPALPSRINRALL